MPITKIRIARGLKANLPVAPNSFEPGRPYFCTDTHELFVGTGLSTPMAPVVGVSSGLTFVGTWSITANYDFNNLVFFQNALWLCLATNVGQQPDISPTFWELVINAGDTDTFVFNQPSPSSTWVINHGLNTSPAIVVENTAHTQVLVETVFNSLNQVTLNFASPEAGTATCHL